MSDDHRQSEALGHAALLAIIGNANEIKAALIRGADRAEIDGLRDKGRALHEAFLDHAEASARKVRSMIDGHPDADSLGEEGARRLLE